jgi:transposase-like protein
VIDHLPEEHKEQVKSLMRAAWKMEAKAGMARIRKLAEWLEREYPLAAAGLRERLEECFTINRLGVPPSLQRCLATTNIIESPHAGVRIRTRRLTNWQNGLMARRWIASTFASTSVALRSAPHPCHSAQEEIARTFQLRSTAENSQSSCFGHCTKSIEAGHTRLTMSRIKQIGVGCGGQGRRPGFTLARNG